MSEQTHEDDEVQFPEETLQVYDLLGITCQIIGNVLGAIGGGFHAYGREFYSAARLQRRREEIALYRREAGHFIESLIEGTEPQ